MSDAPDRTAANAETLTRELAWLARVIETRIAILGGDPGGVTDTPPPDVASEESMYSSFIHHYELGFEERLAVILALLAPFLHGLLLLGHERLACEVAGEE